MLKTSSELCDSRRVRASLHGPTMATRWSVLCDVDHALDQAALHRELAAAVEEVDRQMSPWKPDSALMRLNRSAPGEWLELPAEIMIVLAPRMGLEALYLLRRDDGSWVNMGRGRFATPARQVPV